MCKYYSMQFIFYNCNTFGIYIDIGGLDPMTKTMRKC